MTQMATDKERQKQLFVFICGHLCHLWINYFLGPMQ